ncbi:hypothetical protein MTR67_043847 [Solanum verrucosum]|uniref:Uncharacterized protein n=1 Tax=Solanum verrucosum TaxID=315347 RepID=A0AAF0ZSE5_SOLVR|nr:hypothetical protein MTR67_043847 [Solanum verrucosum]
MSFGFEVTLLDRRKHVGGRLYKKDRRGNKVTIADLGGIVLTGTLGNPPGLLALQLSYTLHKYITVAGGPLLLALVIGEATHKFELTAPTDAVYDCMIWTHLGLYFNRFSVLKGILCANN